MLFLAQERRVEWRLAIEWELDLWREVGDRQWLEQ
jgi:hypothetical protein